MGEESEPVEQQITGTRRGLPVGGQNGRRELARIACAHQPVCRKGRSERFEIRPARECRVQRLKPPGRLQQQRWRIAPPRHREGDLRVQQLGTRLVKLVQRPRLGDREQPQCRLGRAGLVLASYACVDTWLTDFREDLPKIDVPTLVLHGTDDRILPFSATAARLGDLIADVTVVPVEGGPHNIGWTHPEVVNKALLGFLAGTTSAA
jgi:pimeloyl-ACP methyl ester carboxylesterase